jgi:hypothetical protein
MKSILKYFLPPWMCLLLFFNLMIGTAFAQSVPNSISLTVEQGEGVENTIRQRAAQDPVVKVEDEDHRPITGAIVVFTLPSSGPSGEFGNGFKTLSVTTDNAGLATGQGLKTNDTPGKLQIYVSASYKGLRTRTLITQSIIAPAGAGHKSGSGKVWIVVALVGAAAAGGAVAATRKGAPSATSNPAPTPQPIGITPGAGSLSPPR